MGALHSRFQGLLGNQLVAAPRKPGDYLLELDMVQESVSWFAQQGSKPVRLPVTVEPRW
jgi:hypothetical protein